MGSNAPTKSRPIAELLPGLSGIMSKEAMQTFTARKQPRPTLVASRTAEKCLKPMTLAEMRTVITALKVKSPAPKQGRDAPSTIKRWNSSVKVENKTVSHTANGQMKHNSVRKVLNFQQPKPKIPKIHAELNRNGPKSVKMTNNTETPRFTKPENRAKKSLNVPACNVVRISGVSLIPETPLLNDKPLNNKKTIANKENIACQPASTKKIVMTPKSSLHKRVLTSRVIDTPLSNESWLSSCDTSFLEKEKEIEHIENSKALQVPTDTDKAKVSHPMSTPFRECRNVKEFFNYSSDLENSNTQDDTIMCFDKTSIAQENDKREESVIVSLCDMLNKATVSNQNKEDISTELNKLLEFKKEKENNIKVMDNVIKTLINIKSSELKSLHYVMDLIEEKQRGPTVSDNNKTLLGTAKDEQNKSDTMSPISGKPCSVIKSCIKSPSYKLPKKNMSCLRKKVFYKSMPNVSNVALTPPKDIGDRALNMYMKMKEHMNFLKTPVVKQKPIIAPDTPAITSNNLQKQLDKLYRQS